MDRGAENDEVDGHCQDAPDADAVDEAANVLDRELAQIVPVGADGMNQHSDNAASLKASQLTCKST